MIGKNTKAVLAKKTLLSHNPLIMEITTDLLKVTSVACSGWGSYFWIRRNVWWSSSSIAELAKSKYGYSKAVIRELCGQRADSLVAWAYISLATISQAALFFIPTTWNSLGAFTRYHLLSFVIASGILLLIGNFLSRNMERKLIAKTKSYFDSGDQPS